METSVSKCNKFHIILVKLLIKIKRKENSEFQDK